MEYHLNPNPCALCGLTLWPENSMDPGVLPIPRGGGMVRTLCNHVFHADCLFGAPNHACPVCLRPLPTDNAAKINRPPGGNPAKDSAPLELVLPTWSVPMDTYLPYGYSSTSVLPEEFRPEQEEKAEVEEEEEQKEEEPQATSTIFLSSGPVDSEPSTVAHASVQPQTAPNTEPLEDDGEASVHTASTEILSSHEDPDEIEIIELD